MSIRFVKSYQIKGIINCKTGLRIGGTGGIIQIGGIDNPIIRDPLTDYPYIPGSSLKGKMRSLLELKHGKIESNGEVHKYCGDPECFICRIFGTSAGDQTEIPLGPSRLIVRDSFLTEESKEKLDRYRLEKGLLYAEIKFENTIKRVTAEATPRQMERVPAGTNFELELVYRIFDTNDGGKTDEDNIDLIKEGLKLVQEDALGSSGSRGYGKVEFVGLKLIQDDGTKKPFDL